MLHIFTVKCYTLLSTSKYVLSVFLGVLTCFSDRTLIKKSDYRYKYLFKNSFKSHFSKPDKRHINKQLDLIFMLLKNPCWSFCNTLHCLLDHLDRGSPGITSTHPVVNTVRDSGSHPGCSLAVGSAILYTLLCQGLLSVLHFKI